MNAFQNEIVKTMERMNESQNAQFALMARNDETLKIVRGKFYAEGPNCLALIDKNGKIVCSRIE